MDQPAMPSDEPERWLPVPEWEGLYEVSDLGRVRSLSRMVADKRAGQRFKRGRVLALRPPDNKNGSGCPYFWLFLFRDGKRRRFNVHILVARAFLGPPPAGQEVCHGPGGQLDNRLVNLSYGTHAKNAGEDRRRDGTLPQGGRCRNAKLTDEIVTECRARAVAGDGQTALAREFGVAQGTVNRIIAGKGWKHLPLCDDPEIIARADEIKASRANALPEGVTVARLVLHRRTFSRPAA